MGRGRPPKKATGYDNVLLSLRIEPQLKNAMIEASKSYGMSITGYVRSLVFDDLGVKTVQQLEALDFEED